MPVSYNKFEQQFVCSVAIAGELLLLSKGSSSPLGIHVHSTRGVASFQNLLKVAFLEDVYVAAG